MFTGTAAPIFANHSIRWMIFSAESAFRILTDLIRWKLSNDSVCYKSYTLYYLFVLTVNEAYKLQFASSINKQIVICRTTSEREIGEKVYYIILTTKKFFFSRKNRVGYSLLQPMPAAATGRYVCAQCTKNDYYALLTSYDFIVAYL